MMAVLEYKCPCCDAKLIFGHDTQKMVCQYCDNTFEPDTVKEYNEAIEASDDTEFQWDDSEAVTWDPNEQGMQAFLCPSCSGEIMSDATTAATFCPYCGNAAILPGRVSGNLKPDFVIPFHTSREDAQNAFRKLCKGKVLLPGDFCNNHRIEKLTGIYVPFWLYSCSSDQAGTYRATRVRTWSDSNYRYTKTDYYLLKRRARAKFDLIPMDGSEKMDDATMESIEPFDYSQMVEFNTTYLSGYFADRYDKEAKDGEERIRSRVGVSMSVLMEESCLGYSTVTPTSVRLNIRQGKAKYVLFPVWMLSSSYKGKSYVFAMNGQTGKMTGTLPISSGRAIVWFAGIFTVVSALMTALQLLVI